MNGGMLVFHNGTDVSYANHSANLTSMSSATAAITLRFIGQGASATATSTDAVVLTVTAGQEEEVMEFLSATIVNPHRGFAVIADDNLSKYAHDGIEAVDSISVDTGAGTFKNVIVATFTTADTGGVDNNVTLTNANSGSLVTLGATDAASTITLPASPVDGCNYKFFCETDNSAHEIEIAGEFEGCVLIAGAAATLDNTSDITIGASDFKVGDNFELIYSGAAAKWKISGAFITAAAITAS